MSRRFLPCQAPGQAAIAPSRMLRVGSGTREPAVTVCAMPSPWHCGQAPAAVFGEKESDSRRTAPAGYVPAREYSIRSELESVVSVPTDDRELGVPRRCCSATAGGSPVISSTRGLCPCWISRRAYGATDSRNRRWASAKIVPNAREDLPDPETPVNATIASRGTSTSTSRRLFSRAPRTRTKPVSAGVVESVVASVGPVGRGGVCIRTTLVGAAGRYPCTAAAELS